MAALKRTSLPLLLFLLLGVFACAIPEFTVSDTNPNGTAVAQTVDFIMMMTQNAAGQSLDLVASETPTVIPTMTATWTAEPTFTLTPSLTPTPTLTSTATLSPTPILSATPLMPMISVSVPTNCRLGPGKIYDMVGALMVGETAQVYARTADNSYWYVRNPDDPSGFCWLWGEYATLSGLMTGLPVFTPPPSPTPTNTSTPSPGFDASFDAEDSCSGWWIDFLVKNTGSMTFKSINISVRDTVTDITVAAMTDGFTDATGCNSIERSSLLPGKKAIVSSPGFTYDPNNHKLKATLTLCTQTGLNGTCLTDTFSFTP